MLLFGLCALASPAAAHLLPKQNATLHVKGDKGYLVIAVPASAVPEADEDGDGLLAPGEITRHRDAITRRVRSGFSVSTADGPAPYAFLWVADPDGGVGAVPAGAPSPYLIVMAGVTVPEGAGEMTVRTDLFSTGAGEGQITLRARRDNGPAEIAQLTPFAPESKVLRSPAQLFGSFILTGIEHILSGPDHLLFLLTLLVAGITLRQLAVLVTAFTIAHSITLALALLGKVHADPAWVEPGIAASIVLVATLNLVGRAGHLRLRTAMVFACGLLHGLGFASSLGNMAIEGKNRMLTLIGFNLGIEIGQVAFLAVLLLVASGLSRLLHLHTPRSRLGNARLASVVALAFGLFRIVERIVPSLPSVS